MANPSPGLGHTKKIDVWGFPVPSFALAESRGYIGETGRNLFQQGSHMIEA